MKKMAIVLVVVLSASISEASQGQYVAQKKGNRLVADEYTSQYTDEYTNTNTYATMDEYATTNMDEYTNNAQTQNQNQSTIDEYDQQVCDTAQPQAVSHTQQVLTTIAGKLLVYYLSLQQVASNYLHDLKDFLSQWFSNFS